MKRPLVLIVEDNPITAKMVRVALEVEGFGVAIAQDGRSALERVEKDAPDLVLQDLGLPDVDGLELVRRLRATPNGAAIPIVAFTGFLSKVEQAQTSQAGFSDFLFKPIEPSRLVEVVRAYLPPAVHPGTAGRGRRLIVADDDPLQLKLLKIRLEQAGFKVTPAADGQEVLDQLRRGRSDAIVADVLMPRVDGFRLSLAVRRDPEFAKLPVVLVSSAYTDEADRQLALGMGASDLVIRTPDAASVVKAVESALEGPTPPMPAPPDTALIAEYTLRLVRQLEHLVTMNVSLAQRVSLYRAELALLGGFGNAIRGEEAVGTVVEELLRRCITAAGISRGAAYLADARGELRLAGQFGYPTAVARGLEDFFGRPDLIRSSFEQGKTMVVTDLELAGEPQGLNGSVLVTPIASIEKRLGVLVMNSSTREIGEDWTAFGQAVGFQIGQALALGEAFSRLREQEERYREIFEKAAAGIYLSTPEGRFVVVNRALAQMLGYDSPAELIAAVTDAGKQIYVDADRRAEFKRLLAEDGHVLAFQSRVSRKDGSVIWLSEDARAVLDERGSVHHYQGVVVDVTETKRAQEALSAEVAERRRTARRLQTQYEVTRVLAQAATVAEAIPQILEAVGTSADWELGALWRVDAGGGILRCAGTWKAGSSVATAFETTTRALTFALGKGLPGRVWESGRPAWIADLAKDGEFSRTREAIEGLLGAGLAFPVKSGETILGVIEFFSRDYREPDPDLLQMLEALGRQIGGFLERKQAEVRLRESEEQYRMLFDSNPHPMWVFDRETLRFLAVNDAAVAHYGYSRAEFLAMTLEDIRPAEDVQALRRDLAAPVPPGIRKGVFRHRTKDGSLIDVEISAHDVSFDDAHARLVLANDITEKRRLEEQLRQSQKMEAVGRLAGGVAHDFNNLLGVITGYGDLLLRDLSADSRSFKRVEEVRKAANRAASLTRQLLAFSRGQVLQAKVLNLNDIVVDIENMLRRLIGEDVELVTRTKSRLGSVKADPSQIEQVIVNLAVNARDAMPEGGTIIIETANVTLDETYSRRHGGVAPGRYVLLAVTDTGHGMDADTRSRAFEPFFTTKAEGKGTGLGLATVYGIIRQSGGHLELYSELGHGSTFKVYLPRVGEAVEEAEEHAEARPRGTETILLVEDEESLRVMIREILEDAGYTVLEASSPAEALSIAASHAGPIALTMTDVVMPGMSGAKLAERLKEVRPQARILYMSGYTNEAIGRRGILDQGVWFLQKPFTAESLLKKVREALDAAP